MYFASLYLPFSFFSLFVCAILLAVLRQAVSMYTSCIYATDNHIVFFFDANLLVSIFGWSILSNWICRTIQTITHPFTCVLAPFSPLPQSELKVVSSLANFQLAPHPQLSCGFFDDVLCHGSRAAAAMSPFCTSAS